MKTKIIVIELLVAMLFVLGSCSKSYKDYDAIDARNLGDQTIDIINNKKIINNSLALGNNRARYLSFQKLETSTEVNGIYIEKGIYINDSFEYVYAYIENQEKVYYKESLVSSKETNLDDFMNYYIRSFISIDLEYVKNYTYEIETYRGLWSWKDSYTINHKYVFESDYCLTFNFMEKKYEMNNVILKLANDSTYSKGSAASYYILSGLDTTSNEFVSYSFHKE